MARYRLEMDSWPIARLESRVANIMIDPKKTKPVQPYECNPYADQRSIKRKTVQGTISAAQLQDLMVPEVKR